MKIADEYKAAYEGYAEPLALLEKAFQAAGVNVEFELCLSGGFNEKKVVIYRNGNFSKRVSIDGDNPPTAIQDVARAVRW
jgi:hypothetical protein